MTSDIQLAATPSLGAIYLGQGKTRFLVWAQHASSVDLHLLSPVDRLIPLHPLERGYFGLTAEDVEPGARYMLRLDGKLDRPDPASRFQPDGVHGSSAVVDPHFEWHDQEWRGIPLQDYIIYELHAGLFTREGTFEAIIPLLQTLKSLGVTAVELLPIAQFAGPRGWGYDGVFPFAVQNSYGGPVELKKLVDACHAHGLAVLLDVVYNHFGPEGSVFSDYAPYLTERYKTPWGPAINYDGPYSDEVRRYFLENARTWFEEFHFDALRLDAVDHIYDFSARTFLRQLSEQVDAIEARQGRDIHLMIEQDLNSPAFVTERSLGGAGLDAQWTDDFHHALYTLLTGDSSSYYVDFKPDPAEPVALLAKAMREGYVYTGEYSVYRNHSRGVSAHSLPGSRHVVFNQNHDQIGNRMLGERFGQLMSFEALKLAAGIILLSPFLPLIFMGEEYDETAPFQFFSSYGNPELVKAVVEGRREFFGKGGWKGDPPNPQAAETFERCKLDHSLRTEGRHAILQDFYCELIRLRKSVPALRNLSKENIEVSLQASGHVLTWRRWQNNSQAACAFNFRADEHSINLALPSGDWTLALDSGAARWLEHSGEAHHPPGPPAVIRALEHPEIVLKPWSFVLYLTS